MLYQGSLKDAEKLIKETLPEYAYTGENSYTLGYLAPTYAEANYRYILENYENIIETDSNYILKLKPITIGNLEELGDLLEVLDGLDRYPVVSDQYYADVDLERQLEYVNGILEAENITDVTAENILYAAGDVVDSYPYEDGEQYYWSDEDFNASLKRARELKGVQA